MKKLTFIALSIVLYLGILGFVGADYQIDTKYKSIIDKIIDTAEIEWGKKDVSWQINKYNQIIDSFSMIKLQGEQKEIIDYFLYLLKNKTTQLEQSIYKNKQENQIKNVNRDKVEKAILSWHNEERLRLGLTPYTINKKLNYTATIWANELAILKKTSNTHTRSAGDGYYNYDKILSWFNKNGVYFDYKLTAFTESVAYQNYNCNKDDCTQEMIDAIKKGFNFWMSEKGKSSRPHYNAIVSNIFTDLGFGVGVSGKQYWIVAHYGINIK